MATGDLQGTRGEARLGAQGLATVPIIVWKPGDLREEGLSRHGDTRVPRKPSVKGHPRDPTGAPAWPGGKFHQRCPAQPHPGQKWPR